MELIFIYTVAWNITVQLNPDIAKTFKFCKFHHRLFNSTNSIHIYWMTSRFAALDILLWETVSAHLETWPCRWWVRCIFSVATPHRDWVNEPASSVRQADNPSSVKSETMTKWLSTACWHGCVVRPFARFMLCIPLCLLGRSLVLTKRNTHTQLICSYYAHSVFKCQVDFLCDTTCVYVIYLPWPPAFEFRKCKLILMLAKVKQKAGLLWHVIWCGHCTLYMLSYLTISMFKFWVPGNNVNS